MKYIRRSIVSEITGSPLKQKAVAFAMLLKDRTKDSSVIRNYTVYKLQQLTAQVSKRKGAGSKMHYGTIRKYVDVLIKMGLAEIDGRDFRIKKMVASARHRNIDISAFKIDRTKNIFNQLRDLLFLVVQAHKDFVQSLLRLRKDPAPGADFRNVRRLCKKCCGDPNAGYRELGLSYRYIAKCLGCCSRTAFNVVRDAVKRRWCKKTNMCECVEMEGVNFREVPGFTFTTLNHGFIIRANTYTISHRWSKAIGADASRVCAKRYGIIYKL